MNQKEALRKLQNEELDILLAVSRFCEENGIEWFMMSGTALGALRHGGFIPWDDDIDIGMFREQYDRFLQLAACNLPNGYSIHTFDNTHGFASMFAKVYKDGTIFQTAETKDTDCDQAIFIDIFPFDLIPIDATERKKCIRKAMMWQRISYLYHSKVITVPHKGARGFLERIACGVSHYFVRVLFSRETIRDNFNKLIVRNHTNGDGGYLTLSWPYLDPIDRDVFYPPSQASFEGYELPVPARCEEYLSLWYGDWRKLPDPENRHTHLPQLLVFSDGSSWSNLK